MLGPLITTALRPAERPADVLAAVSAAVYDRLYPVPLGEAKVDDPWVSVADLLVDPSYLDPLIEAAARRFRSDDRQLIVAQVARESISALVSQAIELWGRQRRLFDLSAANVALRAGEVAVIAGVRHPVLAVLADDPMADQAGVDVLGEDEMFDRLVDQAIGYPVPGGAVPEGQPASIAAVGAIVATIRRAVRCGERHLWGTAALAIASTAANLAPTVGRRIDEDRDALFAARPDLARTVELVTVDDGAITFGLRRTCCLLFKLPDGAQCGTCSLRDHDAQVVWMTDWLRTERRRFSVRQYGPPESSRGARARIRPV